MTLTQFLTARLDEDAAGFVVPGWFPVESPRGDGWGSRGEMCLLCDRHMYEGTQESTEAGWLHHYEVVHRKTRVLVEVAAKRRILATPVGDEVVRLLALPYADHPDYDEAWRP